MKVTDTAGLMSLVSNASGRNRSVYEDRLEKAIDPMGIHILSFQLLHNDIAMRTRWMVKVMDTMHPVDIWLDLDPSILDKHTWNVDCPEDNDDLVL
jgi:hypothetical protein